MTSATVDITEIKSISESDEALSQLNTKIGLDTDVTEVKSTNYYYSSGSFNFILDKGFRPETLENTALTSVPFLPDWHEGIVSIHGLIIPVIDILAFARTQNIEIEKSTAKKTYLLKLEHKDYSPIVFRLDSLPRLVNTDSYQKTEAKNDSPEWIKSYLNDESTTLALIDHQKLFQQIINKQ